MDLQLPNGYTAHAFASPTAENGLAAPDDMYVDETNTLYVLNHGAIVGPAPFSISVFDLGPSNFGALKGVFRDIDASGMGGLLESATMLPSRPGKLFFSTENYPSGGFGGGQTITELDLATGASRLFWYSPYWNLDPIDTDVTGNMALGHTNSLTGQNEVSRLDPDGNFLDGCTVDVMTDTVRLDPLTGKFLINRPSPGGTQMLDLPTCARVLRSDSPAGGDDEGRFAPGGRRFWQSVLRSDPRLVRRRSHANAGVLYGPGPVGTGTDREIRKRRLGSRWYSVRPRWEESRGYRQICQRDHCHQPGSGLSTPCSRRDPLS
jgi:hypothetical protein